MSHPETITVTRSVNVIIDTDEENYSRIAILSGTEFHEHPEVVARAFIRPADSDETQFVVSGDFVDNHAVQNIIWKQSWRWGVAGVQFDSEAGQFFAYTGDVATAERLATLAVKVGVEVALRRGRL